MKKQVQAKVIKQREISEGVFDLLLSAELEGAVPGQFLMLYPGDSSRLLPRPISICGAGEGTVRLVYRISGEGTREFSTLEPGDGIRLMGPLGNGFPAPEEGKEALFIGGGIGIPPMLYLAKSLGRGRAVLGYRDANTFLLSEFKEICETFIATEDGSAGTGGTVLDCIREQGLIADVVYACGPKPMLKAVREYAASAGMKCYISLEERMACGIGACLGCVCTGTSGERLKICREGPVFAAEDVEL